jgi:serine/threonine protein kinase
MGHRPVMSKLNKPLSFETTFGVYTVDELLGESGAGRVYGGVDAEYRAIALKVLAVDRSTAEKRRRFKNEIAFLLRNKHDNVVAVIDHGVLTDGKQSQPFYIMRRYSGSLRELMKKGIEINRVLPLFSQILDGVEAAHLQRVVHRDLKPENILHEGSNDVLAIADFGIAGFTDDLMVTAVETRADGRLANFQYAAPEQRQAGKPVEVTADIYALGLILNELFTGSVPHGTEYQQISQIAEGYGFLDPIVSKMMRQSPQERPASIAEVKGLIQRHQAEAVSLQKLSALDGSVIKSSQIDEPLAEVPPRLISFDWTKGVLTLFLDRQVHRGWINAFKRMTSYRSLLGKGPHTFSFEGNRAIVDAAEHEIQQIIDYFKEWLPRASETLKQQLEEAARQNEARKREHLARERAEEEQRLRVMRQVKI